MQDPRTEIQRVLESATKEIVEIVQRLVVETVQARLGGLTDDLAPRRSGATDARVPAKKAPVAATARAKGAKRPQAELDALTKKVIQSGLAEWSGALDERKSLIVRGQSNLLKDLTAIEDLERIRQLFSDLESKHEMVQLLKLADNAEGVRIFIGSENKLFSLSGSSVVVAPFHDKAAKVVGIVGVIGPTRINYARIIPMVDYTAKIVSRLLSK